MEVLAGSPSASERQALRRMLTGFVRMARVVPLLLDEATHPDP
jgi:hypothetical protein